MKSTRWFLMFFVLAAPLSLGCGGGGEAGPAATQSDADAYFAAHPEDAAPVEDAESEGGPGS